jgi:hypothetical protein
MKFISIFFAFAILHVSSLFSIDEEFSKRQMVIMYITDHNREFRAALIMDMMDVNQNKSKDKILAVLLEVEFECLKVISDNRLRQIEEFLISEKKTPLYMYKST